MTKAQEKVYTPSMPADMSHICLVDAPPILAGAFESAGYTILALKASPMPFF